MEGNPNEIIVDVFSKKKYWFRNGIYYNISDKNYEKSAFKRCKSGVFLHDEADSKLLKGIYYEVF